MKKNEIEFEMNKITKLSLIVLFLGIGITISKAQSYSKEVLERITKVENGLRANIRFTNDALWTMDERMKFHKINGVSIAVIHDYKLEWSKAYGFADVNMGQNLTTETRFQAASISKSVNAMGVLNLVQKKKLDLNADINDYLTSWKFPYSSVSGNKKITTALLLSHTAGLRENGYAGYSRKQTLPTIPQILGGQKPANSPAVQSIYLPGLKFEYAGGGVLISQLLIMDVTKLDYEDYMQKNVLRPLGMTNSSFDPPSPQMSVATGYTETGEEVE